MTREEVSIAVGADVTTIEQSLGMGRNYFARWGRELKSDGEKYTEWWNAELKKREDAQLASDVRMAQRSNLARRLFRQRAEGAAERAATEIGKGSIPESWQKMSEYSKQSAQTASDAWRGFNKTTSGEIISASGKFSQTFRTAVKSIFGSETSALIKGGIYGAIIAGGVAGWKALTKFMADTLYGVNGITGERDAWGKFLEGRRKDLRKEREQADKDRAAQAEADKERISNFEKIIKKENELQEVRQGIYEEGQSSPGNALQARIDHLESELAIKNSRLGTLTAYGPFGSQVGTEQQILEAQIEAEKVKLELLKAQNQQKDKQSARDKDLLEIQKEQANIGKKELQSFMPTLQELSKRGVFRREARQIGILERQIGRDLQMGDFGKAEADLAQRNKLFDQLSAKGVLPERDAVRRQAELARRQTELLEGIADGKKTLNVKAKMS